MSEERPPEENGRKLKTSLDDEGRWTCQCEDRKRKFWSMVGTLRKRCELKALSVLSMARQRDKKIGAVHRVVGLHVPSRKLTVHNLRYYGFTIIDVCRNAIAQAAPSGASRLESLRRPFLRITDSTATTEPRSSFAGSKAAVSQSTCVKVTRNSWGALASIARTSAS